MKRIGQLLNGHAYLLLEVVPGASNFVANELVRLDSSAVPCAAAVWGPWDVVARVMLPNLGELIEFVDDLRVKTERRVIRTETWCIRRDQEYRAPVGESDHLAFVMLRVNPGQGKLKEVLDYVCKPSTSSEDAKVLHAAGVLGPYDIATTISYNSDVALTNLVMNRFQGEGGRLGIKDTLTIPSIAGMLYPQNTRRSESYHEARDLAAFGLDFKVKFPVAANEIEAARKCYAHGSWTACVFHLMRAIEIGARTVSASLGIANPTKGAERNLGRFLDRIKYDIDGRSAASSWADLKDKKFFGSVYASLSAFKTEWRNPTMHPESNYDEGEATGIFISVRSIMKTLASRMDEKGQPEATRRIP